MNIQLPDLEKYKTEILNKDVQYPLKIVSTPKTGLLIELPKVENKTGWPWAEETEPIVCNDRQTWPKLTIVTPSYNQGKFIEQTIRSVLLQNYPNLEYIVIDGGSTDNTIEVLEKYSPWISYWQSEKDNGQGHAINKGFSIASGQYYAWVNSDDYYLIATFYKVLNKFLVSKTDFVYGYGYNFNNDTHQFNLIKTAPLIDYLIRIPALLQPSCFWNAKIHQPIWEQLHCSLDYELWLRMVKGQRRKLLREPLSVANVHAEAKTHNPDTGKYWAKDHELICSTDAHGPVYNWGKIIILNRLYIAANKIIS